VIEKNINPLVTVIIPVYNRALTIEKTLDSIKKQLYRPIELIVVDDGSSDESMEIIERWSRNNNDEYLSLLYKYQDNAGAPKARNEGIILSHGEYIQFLDSDDTITPEKIKEQVTVLKKSNADMAVCDYIYIYESGLPSKIIKNDYDLRGKIASGHSIYTSTPLISRKIILNNCIYWNEKLKRNQDIDYFIKVICICDTYIYTPGVWCNYIIHSGEQISDKYAITAPQFITKIVSLTLFLYNQRTKLSVRRKKILVVCIVRILINMMGYWSKKYLKKKKRIA